MLQQKTDIIRSLEREILPLQGFKAITGTATPIGLGPVEHAFPNAVFPVGAMHEFISSTPGHIAATGGFITGLLASLMKNTGACLWISKTTTVYPPALKVFGAEPSRIIFITLARDKDILWVMEEALKCEGLSAVVGEIKELDFKNSRRLQLAVEQSRVTGFIIRCAPRQLNTIACVARWQITSLPGVLEDGLPGVGFPRWNVELLKVRNGKPGCWTIEWSSNHFNIIEPEKQTIWLNVSHQYGSAI